jgi:hypothetical protein
LPVIRRTSCGISGMTLRLLRRESLKEFMTDKQKEKRKRLKTVKMINIADGFGIY